MSESNFIHFSEPNYMKKINYYSNKYLIYGDRQSKELIY